MAPTTLSSPVTLGGQGVSSSPATVGTLPFLDGEGVAQKTPFNSEPIYNSGSRSSFAVGGESILQSSQRSSFNANTDLTQAIIERSLDVSRFNVNALPNQEVQNTNVQNCIHNATGADTDATNVLTDAGKDFDAILLAAGLVKEQIVLKVTTATEVQYDVEAVSTTTITIAGLFDALHASLTGTADYEICVRNDNEVQLTIAALQGIEIDLPLEAKLKGVEVALATDAQLSGVEVGLAVDVLLKGIEIGVPIAEDRAHPEWSGSPGIFNATVNADFTVSLTMNSAATDNSSLPLYEVFISVGTVDAKTLFVATNSIGAYSIQDFTLSKLPNGTFVLPATDYTVGAKLVDSFRNEEDQTATVQFTTVALATALLEPPTLQVTDDGTGDSVTVFLASISASVDYDKTEVYQLASDGYSTLVTTLVNVGELFQITGLEPNEEIKLIAVSIDVNQNQGLPSIVYRIVINEESGIPEFLDFSVPSLFPQIVGDEQGVGVKSPIEIGDKGGFQGLLLSSGIDRLEQSIITILKTDLRSRIMRAGFGSDIFRLPYEPLDEFFGQIIPGLVEEAIVANEPRVEVTSVRVVSLNRITGLAQIAVDWLVRADSQRGNLIFPFDLNQGETSG